MKKSKSNKGLILAAAVVAIGGVSFFIAKQYGENSGKGDVVAEINGDPVYNSEAEAQLTSLLGGRNSTNFSGLDAKAKKIIVKELAANKLILQEAYKQGVQKNESIKRQVSEVQDKLVKEQFLISLAEDKVTDDAVKARYEELVKELEGKTQYKVRHIVLETKEEAEKVKKSLSRSSFEDVAKKKSIDTKTAATGGDLGYLLEGNMIKEFDEVIPTLGDNKISQPFKTQFGWHIVKREESRPAEAAKFDVIKARIKQELFAEVIQDYIAKLIENADIEVLVSEAKQEVKSEDINDEEVADEEVKG